MLPKWYSGPSFNSLHSPAERRTSEKEESVSQGDDDLYVGIKEVGCKFVVESMHAVAYINNRVTHSSMKGNTPFKAYFGHKPDVSNLRVFGSTAWARIPLDKRRALQPQRIECLFIGYPDEYKGFKLLDIKTKYIIIQRSVKFDEPLQEVELVKEKTVEFPSYSTKYLDDEIGGNDPDLDPNLEPMLSDIIDQKESSSSSKSELQTHLPT